MEQPYDSDYYDDEDEYDDYDENDRGLLGVPVGIAQDLVQTVKDYHHGKKKKAPWEEVPSIIRKNFHEHIYEDLPDAIQKLFNHSGKRGLHPDKTDAMVEVLSDKLDVSKKRVKKALEAARIDPGQLEVFLRALLAVKHLKKRK